MPPLEDAFGQTSGVSTSERPRLKPRFDVLVVGVAHVGDSAADRDGDGDVGQDSEDDDGVVVVVEVDEDQGESIHQPEAARYGAAGMNATEML